MKIKKIISEQLKCKTCGKLMLKWNPFADEHEHVKCISERVSESLIEVIKRDLFKNQKNNLKNIINKFFYSK